MDPISDHPKTQKSDIFDPSTTSQKTEKFQLFDPSTPLQTPNNLFIPPSHSFDQKLKKSPSEQREQGDGLGGTQGSN